MLALYLMNDLEETEQYICFFYHFPLLRDCPVTWNPFTWTHDAIITTLWRQNDVATSFWRHNDVIIASCARWETTTRSSYIVHADAADGLTTEGARASVSCIHSIDVVVAEHSGLSTRKAIFTYFNQCSVHAGYMMVTCIHIRKDCRQNVDFPTCTRVSPGLTADIWQDLTAD